MTTGRDASGSRRPPGAARNVDTTRLGRMGESPTPQPAVGRGAGAGRRLRAAAGTAARTAARKGASYLAGALGTPAAGAVVRVGSRVAERVGMRRLLAGCLVSVVLLCCLPAGLVAAMFGGFGGFGGGQGPDLAACVPVTADGDGLAELDAEQRRNGEVIVTVGRGRGVPPRGWVIAVATAMQESGLRNLPHLGEENDHDSLGLFQQRPSQGWGTPEELLEPTYAATAFYQRLMRVEGWQAMPLTVAAQAVQRSAYPDAYAPHEPVAVALVEAVATGTSASAGFDESVRCAGWSEVTTAGWARPVPGPMVSGFRNHTCGGAGQPRCHYGADLSPARGTVIRAAADGTVTLLRCNATLDGQPHSCDVDSPRDAAGMPLLRGCGWYLNILHAGGVVTRYCHLLAEPEVEVGQRVAAGQRIGLVGSSGHSSGPHLHFEVHRDGDMTNRGAVDPLPFLAARGVSLD